MRRAAAACAIALSSIVVVLFGLSTEAGEPRHLFPVLQNGRWGFIDRTGLVVIYPRYSKVGVFSEGLCPVLHEGKWGYISEASGEMTISAQFSGTKPFFEGRAFVMKDGLTSPYVLIDTSGSVVGNEEFYQIDIGFSEGLAAVRGPQGWGYINTSGQYVIIPQALRVYSFSEDLAVVAMPGVGGQHGFMDKTGQFTIEPQYPAAMAFNENVAPVVIDGKWGFIDKSGTVVIEPQFDGAMGFSSGRAMVSSGGGGKWGFIDHSGTTVIPEQFDKAYPFTDAEGIAAVKVGENWGFIDTSGSYVVEPQFDYCYGFMYGLAVTISEGREVGYVDTDGNVVWQPKQ